MVGALLGMVEWCVGTKKASRSREECERDACVIRLLGWSWNLLAEWQDEFEDAAVSGGAFDLCLSAVELCGVFDDG